DLAADVSRLAHTDDDHAPGNRENQLTGDAKIVVDVRHERCQRLRLDLEGVASDGFERFDGFRAIVGRRARCGTSRAAHASPFPALWHNRDPSISGVAASMNAIGLQSILVLLTAAVVLVAL